MLGNYLSNPITRRDNDQTRKLQQHNLKLALLYTYTHVFKLSNKVHLLSWFSHCVSQLPRRYWSDDEEDGLMNQREFRVIYKAK